MKCPKCLYEAKPEEIVTEGQCPNCGVFYHKVTGSTPPPAHKSGEKEIASRIANAQAAVAEGRARRKAQDAESKAPGSVSIVAVNIPFLSLVWLMTKIILAAVPALIIAGVIITILASFFGGVISSYQHYSDRSQLVPPSISAPAMEPSGAALTLHERCKKTEELGGAIMLGRQNGLSRADAMSSVTEHGGYTDVVLRRIVSSAYERPRHSSAAERLRQVETFKRETYEWCIREGI